MIHLDEFTLNEYLDHALDEATTQQVEVHLHFCQACREALAEVEAVFMVLGQVADRPLTTDLSARMLPALQLEATPVWVWGVLLTQAITAAVLLLRLWASVEVTLGQMGQAVETAVANGLSQITTAWAEWVAWGTAVWQSPPAISPTFDLATTQWLFLLGLTLIAWLIGNRLLITGRA